MAIAEVLVGGLMALGGALGASWLQNRHEAQQRERERQLSLRKEVYLEAAEGLSGVQEYLGGLADAARTLAELAQCIKSRPGWQNKVHVVASLETISAFAEADAYFVSAALSTIPLRYDLDESERRLEAAQGRKNQLQQYQSYLHTSLQAQVKLFPAHPAVVSAGQVREAIDATQGELVRLGEQVGQLLEQRAAKLKQLVEGALERVAEHRKLVATAMLAVRDEIKLPLPKDAYMDLVSRTNAEVLASMRHLLEGEEIDSQAPSS